MTTIRKFCCNDFLRFSSVNLDHLTITADTRTYLSWLAQWPDYFNVAVAPGNRIMGYIIAAVKGEGEGEEDQGSLVAGGVQDEGEGWFGQITTISVHPDYRIQGLGTKLMRLFESQLLDKMYFSPRDLSYSMRCFVSVTNKPARIFFGKFGFENHRCLGKLIAKKEDAVDMRKVLVEGGDFEVVRLSTSDVTQKKISGKKVMRDGGIEIVMKDGGIEMESSGAAVTAGEVVVAEVAEAATETAGEVLAEVAEAATVVVAQVTEAATAIVAAGEEVVVAEEEIEVELDHDVLGLIVQKVCHCIDFLSFGRVCKKWKRAIWENINYLPLGRFPGVLVPGETPQSQRRLFTFKYSSGYFEPISYLPIPHNLVCSGSAYGWVFLTDENLNTKLYNPFTRKELKLPSLETLPNNLATKQCVCKAIYTSNPSFLPYPIIVIIFGVDLSRLAFCQPQDDKWTVLNEDFCTDAIYWKNKFYVLRASGQVICLEIKCNGEGSYLLDRSIIAPPPRGILEVIHFYLVEVNGVLVKVSRELGLAEEQESDDDDKSELRVDETEDDGTENNNNSDVDVDDDGSDNTSDDAGDDENENSDDKIYSKRWKWLVVGFMMQRFDDIEQDWVKLESLGDYSIFVGSNTSFSLRAADFPGCIPNAVYFGGSEGFEMGIFNLSNQTMNRHVTNPPFPMNDSTFPFPLWIDHTLWSLLADK